ncbi:MAG: alkaline phosphatase PhoX [Bacteroidota bacterium]
MKNSRRTFIKQSVAVSLGFSGLSHYLVSCSGGGKAANVAENLPVSKEWIDLPDGFSAKIISRWGDTMSDGFKVPGLADGMAAFSVDGNVVLVRNHEIGNGEEYGPFGTDQTLKDQLSKESFFDYGFGKQPCIGGTTNVVFNEATQTVEKEYLSLVGTIRNCAGGPTPWNTWITCEEDVTKANDLNETAHGYNFEVPAAAKGLVKPVALKEMGRFNHEAVCVDPRTGIVYQTEDRHDSLIYRYLPNVPGELHKGGRLQALAIKEQASFDTRNYKEQAIQVGQPLDAVWIDLEDTDPEEDDLRIRGYESGAAVFARGEGMWYGNEEVYFACTSGGKNKTGQVFKYIPGEFEGTEKEAENPGKLVLFAEPNDQELLKYCDNLTVAPWGDVVLVEDDQDSYMRGITPEGKIYNIARNIGSQSEMAGVCFSPSGKTLFVNVQKDGLTFAITGPWDKLRA